MTREGLAALIQNSSDELAEAKRPFIQDAEVMLNKGFFEENHRSMHQLLNRFLGA